MKGLKWIERGVDAAKRIESLGKYLAALAALVLFAVSLNDRKSQAVKELGHQVQVLDQLMAFEATAQAMEQSAESIARSSREMVKQTMSMQEQNRQLKDIVDVSTRMANVSTQHLAELRMAKQRLDSQERMGDLVATVVELQALSATLAANQRHLESLGQMVVFSGAESDRKLGVMREIARGANERASQLFACEAALSKCSLFVEDEDFNVDISQGQKALMLLRQQMRAVTEFELGFREDEFGFLAHLYRDIGILACKEIKRLRDKCEKAIAFRKRELDSTRSHLNKSDASKGGE